MKVVVVYNSQSGSALSQPELKRHFQRASISVAEWLDVTQDDMARLDYWRDQKIVVAAVGGDGTLSSVAARLIGARAVFAPLPGGTLNHFTKDLGVPQDIEHAIQNITTAKPPRKIDAASVNGTVFINNSSIGVYPFSLQARERLERLRLSKWPAAVFACLEAFIAYRPLAVTIGAESFTTPFLFVGNNDYHLDDVLGKGRTSLDQAVLSVYAVTATSRWGLVKALIVTLLGRTATDNQVHVWTTTKLTIHARRDRLRVSRDGELDRLKTPLRYESLPGALQVIDNS